MPHLIRADGAPAGPLDWHGDGLPLQIADLPPFDPDSIDQADWSLWRYGALLPVRQRVSLGEGGTPLVYAEYADISFHAKLEFLNPTGSYKDRGTALLVNYLLDQGVIDVVEDSSGNAGASLAAYAAAAGLRARIFAPASAPAGKKALIRAFGAELVEVEGPRARTTEAVMAAAAESVYASHAWSPFFVAGQMTTAWEIWEQMGAPDAVVCPVGHGGLFTGLARGFAALQAAHQIPCMPRLYAVQAAACDPVVRAWEAGADAVTPVAQGATIADGIVITQPVHGDEIVRWVRATGGAALRVDDAAIAAARAGLAGSGLLVEPTSAAVVAALGAVRAHLGAGGRIALPLTGSGLKAVSV